MPSGRSLPALQARQAAWCACLLACTDGSSGDANADSGTAEPAPLHAELGDANNFSYTAAIDIPSRPLAARTDAWLSWAELTVDMLGHPFHAEEVTDVALVVFSSSQAEVEAQVAADDVQQAEVSLFVTCEPEPGAAGCWLSDFGLLGTDVDLEERFEEDTGTWMLTLATAQAEGRAARYRRLLFLEPSEGSTETVAELADDEGRFEIAAELEALEPVPLAAGTGQTVSWAGLTRDGRGEPLDLFKLDLLTLAWIEGRGLAEVEASFLDLERDAEGLYELDVTGRQEAGLDELPEAPGLIAEGLWLLGLRCGTCASPMPRFLTVLEVR